MIRMKIILLLLINFVTVINVFGIEIYNRKTLNGGVDGYSYTVKSVFELPIPLAPMGPAFWPVVKVTNIDCHDPGSESCPTTIGPNNNYDIIDDFNQIDVVNVNFLVSHANSSVDNGNFNGSYTISVQMINEDFLRLYSVIWMANEVMMEISVNLDLVVL
jgi:hypothetical protein